MGGYPKVRFEQIITEYMNADIVTKALEYILFIKHAAGVVWLKESEEDDE